MRLAKQYQFIPLQNVVYFITLPFLVRKIFTFYINDVLLFKCPFPGPRGLSKRSVIVGTYLRGPSDYTLSRVEAQLRLAHSIG